MSKTQGLQFILNLLNLRRDDQTTRKKFCKDYHEFIPWEDAGSNEIDGKEFPWKMLNSHQGLGRLDVIRGNLSFAWRMPTAWDRQVAMAGAVGLAVQDFLNRFAQPNLQHLRPYAPNVVAAAKTLGAILRTMESAASLRFCGNSDCLAPYFIAERSTQKFCNEVCAKPAQRAYKKDWWNKHGAEWQRTRQKAKQKKQRRP